MTVVRTATVADADAVWALVRDFATSFRPERAAFDRLLPELLARDDVLVLVAEDDAVVGYLLASEHPTFFANGPVAGIEEVMVAPDRRRSGIGAALMAGAEAWAAGRGAGYVSLASRRAGDFYLSLGYTDSAVFYKKSSGAPF
ncbi:GNAT family N-acetyltransferase [Pseudolysinimonas sp.]|jgi:GNAT superfamily N-acetyltransferase|uniref:GNAT family N-acetyltransferase n=1 Tax=Pseudolysinimonas sp. TaxID=2680009 RepID=UPI0037835581